MNSPAERSVSSSTADTRLRQPWLVIGKTIWITLVALTLGLFVIGLPSYYQQLQTACRDATTCAVSGALNAKGLQALASFGFSVNAYATYNTALLVCITLVWCVVAFILFWHRSDDWMVLLVSFCLIAFNPTYPGGPSSVLAMNHPALYIPNTLVASLGQLSFNFFFYLFPNGRFVPRWIGWFTILAIIAVITQVVPAANSPFYASNWPAWLIFLEGLLLTATILFSQVYRYVRISTPVHRQQTKWVVFGMMVTIVGNLGLGIIFGAFFPQFQQPGTPYLMLPNTAWPLVNLSIPVCIGIATLRYRLYDIDVLINRTLVYGTLTALLTLTYVGLILVLQFLTHALTGQSGDHPVLLVGSTLVIAALFHPLRRRIQQVIDRRFYRRKYDAAKTVAAFSATLRNELDLAQLNEQLVAVVEETMQPCHVWLWLPPAKPARPQLTAWRSTPPDSSTGEKS